MFSSLRKSPPAASFRGVRQPTDDDESRKGFPLRARFLASLGMTILGGAVHEFPRLLLALVLSGALVPAALAGASQPTVKEICDAVICQCGCNQTVTECNHLQCTTRAEMTAMARREIAEGKDETAILQDFVQRYGVKVLAAPPTHGFNLAVWILPGIGLLVGLTLVVGIVRRWRRPPAAAPAGAPPLDPEVMAAVEKEMKQVTGS
jgi:cytochrome c-type biogenesis protein CcmH/NrfF